MEEMTTNAQGAKNTATEQDVQQEEKKFTQKELEEKIAKRLERERKKYPTEEKLQAFREWEESQQTQQEKWDTLQAEKQTLAQEKEGLQKQLEQFQRERYLLSKGISVEDVDYYVFKIGKTLTEDTDFETAADAFLKDIKEKKGKEQEQTTTLVHFGAKTAGGNKSFSIGDEITRKLRGEL